MLGSSFLVGDVRGAAARQAGLIAAGFGFVVIAPGAADLLCFSLRWWYSVWWNCFPMVCGRGFRIPLAFGIVQYVGIEAINLRVT